MVYIWVVGITRIIRRVVKDELEGGGCVPVRLRERGRGTPARKRKGRVASHLSCIYVPERPHPPIKTHDTATSDKNNRSWSYIPSLHPWADPETIPYHHTPHDRDTGSTRLKKATTQQRNDATRTFGSDTADRDHLIPTASSAATASASSTNRLIDVWVLPAL